MRCTKIKVCGVTTAQQAVEISRLGVEAIGLVFYQNSPRAVDMKTALDIKDALQRSGSLDSTQLVALCVQADDDLVENIIEQLAPSVLQFHGDESASQCQQYEYPYWKALRVRPMQSVAQVIEQMQAHTNACGLLLDAYSQKAFGGTGECFDWQKWAWHELPGEIRDKLILAGGLRAQNVQQAISVVRPVMVDVSSGVEQSPGQKDLQQVKQFIQQVQEAL